MKARRLNRRRSMRGMTLIEIMVVLVILGMIAGAIGWNVMGSKKEADIMTARNEVRHLADGITAYTMVRGKAPDSLDEAKDFINRLHNDPWQQPYQYIRSGDSFEVLSYGPNKSQGGGDDISSKELDSKK